MIVTNVPLWSVTIWDKKYNAVEKEWQSQTKRYKYLLSDELDRICVEGGSVRLLYTGKDIGYTTEELAGDALAEGEIVAIPWGGTPSVKYYHGKFVTGDNRIATSSKPDELLNKYLYYYLLGHLNEIASYYRGAGLKHPSMRDVLKMNISYPAIDEQKRIISLLDMIEDLISKRKQQIVSFDELVKSRFIELFGSQCHNEKNYPYGKIDDVAEIYLGLTHTPEYIETGVKFISAKNTSCDYLDLSDVKYISKEEYASAPAGAKPRKGDVLFSRVGSNLGHPVILDIDEELCTFVSLGYLRTKGRVTNLYLKHWMRDDFFAEQVRRKVVGGGQPNLNTGWLKEFRIIIPPMDIQEQFAAFVEQTDKSKLCGEMEVAA